MPASLRRTLRMSETLPSGLSKSTFYPPTNELRHSKRGWLRRQGGIVRSWQQRWFAMRGQCLFYYTSEDESKAHVGSIFLPGYHVQELPQQLNEPDKFLFIIQPDGDRARTVMSNDSHLLCAVSDDDRKQWLLAIRKILYADKGGALFGQNLVEIMSYQCKRNRRQVPDIAECCVNFLLRHGLETEGIFRLPGRSVLVRRLREAFDCGDRPVLLPPDTDPHSVASLFKQFLRELPEPLIPLRHYERVMQLCTRDVCERRSAALSALRSTVAGMHPAARTLLAYVSLFLHKVGLHSSTNRMTPANLATVFVQAYIRPEVDDPVLLMGTSGSRGQAVLVFITCAEHIFGNDETPADQLTGLDLLDGHSARKTSDSDVQPQGVKWPEVVAQPEKDPAESVVAEDDSDKSTCLRAGRNSVNRRRSRPQSSVGLPGVTSPRRPILRPLAPGKSLDTLMDSNLLTADVSSWSMPLLRSHVETLRAEVTTLRDKQQTADQRIQRDTVAMAEAVTKIVQLQSTIQQYQMRYGTLH